MGINQMIALKKLLLKRYKKHRAFVLTPKTYEYLQSPPKQSTYQLTYVLNVKCH